jgi:hypothetical protein
VGREILAGGMLRLYPWPVARARAREWGSPNAKTRAPRTRTRGGAARRVGRPRIGLVGSMGRGGCVRGGGRGGSTEAGRQAWAAGGSVAVSMGSPRRHGRIVT